MCLPLSQTIDKTEFADMMRGLRERGGRGGRGQASGTSKKALDVAETEARMMAPLFDVQTAASAAGRLSYEEFAAWVGRLNRALVHLEFAHYASDEDTNRMTPAEFGDALVDSLKAAGRQDVAEYSARVEKLRAREQQVSDGLAAKSDSAIPFEDFYQFQMLVVYDLAEVERGLSLFRSDSRRFGRQEFTRAVKAARRSNTSLSPALLDALWAVLDKSGDGQIEFTDFFTALQCRRPQHPGSGKLKLGRCFMCCKQCLTQAVFPAL